MFVKPKKTRKDKPRRMPKWMMFIKNPYEVERVIRETENRIDLLLVIVPGVTKEARLPKKKIDFYRNDMEVMIPEWLCLKQELF
jgi:hypothetical protein